MLTVEGNAEGADIGRLKRRLSVQLRTREVCRPACDGGGRLNFVWMRVASGGVHRRSGAVPPEMWRLRSRGADAMTCCIYAKYWVADELEAHEIQDEDHSDRIERAGDWTHKDTPLPVCRLRQRPRPALGSTSSLRSAQ